MNYPKINFIYSSIYDEIWKGNLLTVNNRSVGSDYPSPRRIQNYIKVVNRLWRKDEKKVLTELSKISQLRWKEKNIRCYIVGKCIPFSDPLTISIYKKSPDNFIDILIHELIHRLFIQDGNLKKSANSWSYFEKKYKKESKITKNHIVLHAIHSHIYLKIFNQKRLKRDIKNISFIPAYKRAWEIVQTVGYKNIISEFTSKIRQ